jgi:invasion protein IalB
MTDQMRTWLMRGAIALGILFVGVAAGWIFRGLGQPDVPRVYVYQDWRLVCPKDSESKASCQLADEFVDPRTGTQLAAVSFEHQDGKRVVVIKTPLTVLIPAGVGLQFGSDTKTFQYSTCAPLGCFAFVPLDDKLQAAFDTASSLSVVVTVSQNGKSAAIPMPIKGYAEATKAFNNIEARRHSWWRRLWS